ncbi:MAG: NAD(P)H-dependent oxidoreductase [Ginsengibacter sp.]
MYNKIKIVAISGSLRNNSSATYILKHVIKLFPETIDFTLYEGIGMLPHFDDNENVAPEVTAFRKLLAEADGVFISQPEYAFGVAGSLKNALDWTVSSGELVDKPVALVTAATGGDKAHAALLLTLKALSSKAGERATLLIPFVRTKLNDTGEVINDEIVKSLTSVVNALVQTIMAQRDEKSMQA